MRARIPRCRGLSLRVWALIFLTCSFLMYCYFYTGTVQYSKSRTPDRTAAKDDEFQKSRMVAKKQWFSEDQCPIMLQSHADVDTVTTFQSFQFTPQWVPTKEFWDKSFEDRYTSLRYSDIRPQLKVFVVPHSHNDPGWLKTFEQYFEWKTKNIINNIVQKLEQYPDMTFIWNEIVFLEAWWERAHPSKQNALKKLIKQGRLEITTGGWVMPDEACTHIYSLLDQYIEGHDWVKTHLGISPKTGWSVDPFGHGPTVPHILDQSGVKGTIIQRIHYSWKQFLAEKQMEEFYWIPGWSTKKPSLIVHNMPFDIYSIKSTCGPHPSVCLGYDFRLIPGEYSEYTAKHEEITDQNLHKKAKTLIEEYHRIGTLTPHNVVLVPLGDDFRYEYAAEFDSQYSNYQKLFEYINGHPDMFNAYVQFGTPHDYFTEVKKRYNTSTVEGIRTLKGDFFVYSDIFSSGKPAYWSGYYTTRPYMKILARQFEHQLRTSEILFTLIFNTVKTMKNFETKQKKLEKTYEQLVVARRNLGLIQHHDAITGTSKAAVTYDYGTKIFTSLYHCIRLQETVLSMAMIPQTVINSRSGLQSEVEWETYGKPVKRHQHEIKLTEEKKIVVFNSLAEERVEVVTTSVSVSNVKVYDNHRNEFVAHQIIPTIDVHHDGRRIISDSNFELIFVAKLPALTAVTFTLSRSENDTAHCDVFCSNCGTPTNKKFNIMKMPPGDILLENSVLRILVNRNTGFLRQVYRKDINMRNMVEMEIGAYRSAQGQSGAYLFMPDIDTPEKSVLEPYANFDNLQDDNIIILSGPITTEIKIMYLPFLVHTIKIFNVDDYALSHAVFIENIVDFESPPKNRETELFMRFNTDILNNNPQPEFFSDQNGFQYQRRVKIDSLGIEGNYYPITTMAWIQDAVTRMTFITNHAQGASSYSPGRLEVMLDRRMLYDDYRGLGEGIVDNKQTIFQNWIIFEATSTPDDRKRRHNPEQSTNEPHSAPRWGKKRLKPKSAVEYQLPSQTAEYLSRSLNYPVNVFFLDASETGDTVDLKPYIKFVQNFPENIHLLSLRTITDAYLDQMPSRNCYMILHRPGVGCSVGHRTRRKSRFTRDTKFNNLKLKQIRSVSLTGLETLYNISSIEDISLDPMDLKTFKVQF